MPGAPRIDGLHEKPKLGKKVTNQHGSMLFKKNCTIYENVSWEVVFYHTHCITKTQTTWSSYGIDHQNPTTGFWSENIWFFYGNCAEFLSSNICNFRILNFCSCSPKFMEHRLDNKVYERCMASQTEHLVSQRPTPMFFGTKKLFRFFSFSFYPLNNTRFKQKLCIILVTYFFIHLNHVGKYPTQW